MANVFYTTVSKSACFKKNMSVSELKKEDLAWMWILAILDM